tara:strand:- start:344 stop:610 length:267 start_codon:yes stop_codon:yes gene_type:complete
MTAATEALIFKLTDESAELVRVCWTGGVFLPIDNPHTMETMRDWNRRHSKRCPACWGQYPNLSTRGIVEERGLRNLLSPTEQLARIAP